MHILTVGIFSFREDAMPSVSATSRRSVVSETEDATRKLWYLGKALPLHY